MERMSQTRAPAGGRYQRSNGGLVGAMIVSVVLVLLFVGYRAAFRDNKATPLPDVDYSISLKAGRAEKELMVLAPPSLPRGWRATSASYHPGSAPTWHLGLLTPDKEYVGVEESRATVGQLVQEHVDPDAARGKDVTIAGERWQSYTDSGGDYAVARSLRQGGRSVESYVVVGSAPDATIRAFAATLEGGTVRPPS